MAAEKKEKKEKKAFNPFKSIKEFFVGEVNEIKRIRWPHFDEIGSNTVKVIIFCILFALFFVLCDLAVSKGLLVIGVGQ